MDKPHIFLYLRIHYKYVKNLSLFNGLSSDEYREEFLTHIKLYFFIEKRINLSITFMIFLKEVCKVHTLFVVFYNILHKTLRYEVMKLQTGSVWDSNG